MLQVARIRRGAIGEDDDDFIAMDLASEARGVTRHVPGMPGVVRAALLAQEPAVAEPVRHMLPVHERERFALQQIARRKRTIELEQVALRRVDRPRAIDGLRREIELRDFELRLAAVTDRKI